MVLNAVICHEEQILNCNMSDTEDGETGVNQEKDNVVMAEELPSCSPLVFAKPGMHLTFLLVCFYVSEQELFLILKPFSRRLR